MRRQPASARITAPHVGAIMGTTLIAPTMKEIFARAAFSSNRSRTMATAIIPGAAVPAPWTTRQASSAGNDGALAQPTLAIIVIAHPKITTGFRPYQPQTGP